MQFYGEVWGVKKNKWLNCGGDSEHDPAFVEICALQVLHLVISIIMSRQ